MLTQTLVVCCCCSSHDFFFFYSNPLIITLLIIATQFLEMLLEKNQTLMRIVRTFLSKHRKHLFCTKRGSILVVTAQENKEI